MFSTPAPQPIADDIDTRPASTGHAARLLHCLQQLPPQATQALNPSLKV